MPYRPRSLSEANQYHAYRHSADRPERDPYQLNWGEAGIVLSGTVISYTDYWTAIYAIEAPSVQIDGAVFS